MRFKRRYFCVELVTNGENKLKPSDLSAEFARSIEKLYGDYGVATIQPSFSLIYFNANTNLAVFRVARENRQRFHELLTFMRRVDSTELTFKVIHVAGSIKKCKKFLLDYSYRKLEQLYIGQNSKSQSTGAQNHMAIDVIDKLVNACQQDDENFY